MKTRRSNPLRTIRILVATVIMVCLIMTFVDPLGWAARYLGWTAEIQLIPAILSIGKYGGLASVIILALLVVLTLLFGRVYCSTICPLGAMQDVFRRLKIGKRVQYHYHPENKVLRWSILAIFLILLFIPAVGWIAYLLDPYSYFGRIVTAASHHTLSYNKGIISGFQPF